MISFNRLPNVKLICVALGAFVTSSMFIQHSVPQGSIALRVIYNIIYMSSISTCITIISITTNI